MNHRDTVRIARFLKRYTSILLLFFIVCFSDKPATASGSISDGGSTFTWVTSPAPDPGFFTWQLQPTGILHEYQMWFWYRVNPSDTREFPLPMPPTSESFVGNVATLNWSNVDGKNFDVQVVVTLTEVGPNMPRLLATSTVTNNLSGPLDIEIFGQLDLDIMPSYLTNVASSLGPGLMQISGASPDVFEFLGGAPDAFESGHPWSGVRAIRDGLMKNSVVDNLNNSGLPYGPGDWAAAYQWNKLIPIGQSESVSFAIGANTAAVIPAPPLPPASAAIPTVSEWGLIFLFLCFLSVGSAWLLQKKRKAAIAQI